MNKEDAQLFFTFGCLHIFQLSAIPNYLNYSKFNRYLQH